MNSHGQLVETNMDEQIKTYIDGQIAELRQEITKQNAVINVVRRYVAAVKQHAIDLKDYTRRDNIVVFGIPENVNRLQHAFRSILRDMKGMSMPADFVNG